VPVNVVLINGQVVVPPAAPPTPPPSSPPPPPPSPPPVSSELPLPGGASQIPGTFATPPPTPAPTPAPPISSELPLPGGLGQIPGVFAEPPPSPTIPGISSELPLPGGESQIGGIFDVGGVIGAGGLPGGSGGIGSGVGDTDDLAASAAIANANRPDLSDLEAFELLDPFGLQEFGVTNPPLKGGGALSAIAQACSDFGVDTLAVVADALHEGAGGGMGDGGLAYGPFQDHLTEFAGRPFYGKGRNNPVVNAWAWSENGIRYSVRQMATASPSARGLRGHPAVYAIVYGYERPQDKAGASATRAAEYDRLVARGAGWAAYAAPLFNGPAAGGGVDSTPIATPGAAPYKPAGVTAQWRGIVDVFKLTVPRQHDRIDSLAKGLKEVFR
jgi:hypothetical protein